MEKYTKDGLPIVSSETFKAFVKEVEDKGDSEVDKYIDEIEGENPCLGYCFRKGWKMSRESEEKMRIGISIIVYMCFKRQAQANKMEESLK